MYQSQINVRYAKSLFELAKEKNLLDEVMNDISLILKTIEGEDDFNELLNHPVISANEKGRILAEIFKQQVNEHTMSFFGLIIKNKREKHLKSMCLNFIDLFYKYKGLKKAIITSAIDLNRTEKEKIKQSIEKKFNATIELENKVDESLIGGMIIQVEDKQLDLSVAKQIQNLKREFLTIDFNNKSK